MRQPGASSLRIEVAKPRVHQPSLSARKQPTPHQLYERFRRCGIVVEHVVGKAPARRRGVLAHGTEALRDRPTIALDRLLRISGISPLEKVQPVAPAHPGTISGLL